ncbi:MAG: phosphotransferase [Plesiomonas sp.]
MECLTEELSLLLGEKVSRTEIVGKGAFSTVFALYDSSNAAFPVVAKAYPMKGMAESEISKLSVLARHAMVRMPAIYGVHHSEQSAAFKEVVLMERLAGISVTAPCRNANRSAALSEQIADCLLSWHRVDGQGLSGLSGELSDVAWPLWYRQYLAGLWSAIEANPAFCDYAERIVLYRSLERYDQFFSEFDDASVLVHGDFKLRNLLKDAKTDQLIAAIDPGPMQCAPREFDLIHLCCEPFAEKVLSTYLQRAPVAEQFAARRWLYKVWDEVACGLKKGKLDQSIFAIYSKLLTPWLE